MAIRLARFGLRVCVIESGSGALPVAECLTPALQPLLNELGVLPSIEQAGFVRCTQTRVRWSAPENAAREGQALVVKRAHFDRILLDASSQAGACVLHARARRPTPGAEGWVIPTDGTTGSITVEARFLVNAAGRHAIRSCLGVPTVALCGRWQDTGMADAREMRVEAGPTSWCWGAPQPDASYGVIAFLDMHDGAGLGPGGRESLYRSLLGRSGFFKHFLGRKLIGQVTVRDATCRLAGDPVTAQSLRVGDAAFAMDPISSQGVQSAIRSGFQGALVVQTILSGGDAGAAIEFYTDVQRGNAQQHRRIATGLYASQALHDSVFWRTRSEGVVQRQPKALLSPVGLTPETALRLSADSRLVELPAIDGNVIRRRAALCHPSLERPVVWLADAALGPALSVIGTGRRFADILREWSKAMSAETAHRMLQWLLERGVLECAECQLDGQEHLRLAKGPPVP